MTANKRVRQTSQYDKVFKENIETVISSIVKNMLKITIVSMEELPDDIQHTKERKPDILKKVTDDKGTTFILQIEFQVADEPEMIYRMLEYYAMLERKYKIPIKQFVIFLGSKNPKMPVQLNREMLNFKFSLISFAELDYRTFLNSDKPEEVILSILADFKGEDPKTALKQIIHRIEETTKGDLALKRYFKQLRILAQLRRLEQKLKTIIMDSIAKYIDEEKDVAFLVGKEKEQIKFVTNLLQKLSLTTNQIADIAGVSEDFVRSVEEKIAPK